MKFNDDFKKTILETIQATPSAHNTQPLRIKFIRNDSIEVYAIKDRLLPYADPLGHDFFISLGVLMEGIELALTQFSYAATNMKFLFTETNYNEITGSLEKILVFDVKEAKVEKSRLFSQIPHRFSYRGKFSSISPDQEGRLSELIEGSVFLSSIKDKEVISILSENYDDVNIIFLNKFGYIEELYSWMRFFKKDSSFLKDGLNYESLSLNGFESWGASIVMKPMVFRFLCAMKLGKVLISEKANVMSSHAFVGIHAPYGTSTVEQGRIFYKTWLLLTELGLFCAPLSLLCEDQSTVKQLKKEFKLKEDCQLINVLRVGALPEGYSRYRPARIAIEELLIN